jgi:hypothetical protein
MGEVKFTDPLFSKVLGDLSSNGTLFFTAKQFLYFLDRKLKRQSTGWGRAIFLYVLLGFWSTGFLGILLLFINIILSLAGILLFSMVGNNTFLIALVLFNFLCIFRLFIRSNSPQTGARGRKSSANMLVALGVFVLLAGSAFRVKINSGVEYSALSFAIGFSSLLLGVIQRFRIANITDSLLFDSNQVEHWLEKWAIANGSVQKLLAAPSETLPTAPEQMTGANNYSFDRLVVCDRPEIAQMLIANNFHFEHNCAVLCISGYPQQIFDTAMTMLRRNPELQVFAIHDCSPRGLQMVQELRNSPDWFANTNIEIVDIGLSPRQVLTKSQSLTILNSPIAAREALDLNKQIRHSFSSKELAWLDKGNFVELESFTPQQLLVILQRGIARASQLDSDRDSDMVFVDGNDGGFYTIDSFG